MLAAAFIHEPALVFLDEPFINLDPIYQRKLRDFLAQYVDRGGTAFMASHLLEIAGKLCDRVAVIQKGSHIATRNRDPTRGGGPRSRVARLRPPRVCPCR